MRIKHRFTFHEKEKKIFDFLNKHDIEFDHNNKSWVVVFEVFEDHKEFSTIKDFMKLYNSTGISAAVYTKEEIESAQWLSVYSTWRSLYPHPRDDMGYRHTTYNGANLCEGNGLHKCDKALIQKENFVLEKEPNWGPRNFLMINWVGDEFFISQKAEAVLRNSQLVGFDIYDVNNKMGNAMQGVKQLFIKNYLDYGMHPDSIGSAFVCPKCGLESYMMKAGVNHFKREIFEGVEEDIIKTKEKFGEIISYNLILVTHKFYEVVTKAKLDRGLVFEPIVLI